MSGMCDVSCYQGDTKVLMFSSICENIVLISSICVNIALFSTQREVTSESWVNIPFVLLFSCMQMCNVRKLVQQHLYSCVNNCIVFNISCSDMPSSPFKCKFYYFFFSPLIVTLLKIKWKNTRWLKQHFSSVWYVFLYQNSRTASWWIWWSQPSCSLQNPRVISQFLTEFKSWYDLGQIYELVPSDYVLNWKINYKISLNRHFAIYILKFVVVPGYSLEIPILI